MKILAAAVLAILGVASRASAEGHRVEEPSLALAALQAPGLDMAHLNHFFDVARLQFQTLTAPKAAAQAAPKPVTPPALSKINTEKHSLVVPPPVASALYQHTFNVLMAHPEVTDQYDDLILKYAEAYGLEPRLLKAVIAAESEFMLEAVSPRGAHGLMQVMPATAREMGVDFGDLHDPEHNIQAGAAYVAHLFASAFKKFNLKGVRFQDAPLWIKERVIAAYNAGPRFLWHNRWFTQTKQYVRKVMLFYGSKVTDLRRPPRRFWPTAASYPTDSAAIY
jgi:membrane-bound lytic murein transglycosylase B